MIGRGGKINAVNDKFKRLAAYDSGKVDEVPIAADAPGVPLFAVGFVGARGERIVAVGCAGVEFHLPRQHSGAVFEVLIGQHAGAGGGIVEVELAASIVAGVDRSIARESEGIKLGKGIAVSEALGGGGLGFACDSGAAVGCEGVEFEGGRTSLISGVEPIRQLIQIGVVALAPFRHGAGDGGAQ